MSLVSPIYGGLLALLSVGLSVRVSVVRRKHGVSVGDGGHRELIKAIRVHANSTEYIPIGIVLLVLLEFQNTAPWLVHLAGSTLLAGRLLHAYGLGRQPQMVPARVYGAYLTLISITAAAVANIVLAAL